jgi:hypothetical protein
MDFVHFKKRADDLTDGGLNFNEEVFRIVKWLNCCRRGKASRMLPIEKDGCDSCFIVHNASKIESGSPPENAENMVKAVIPLGMPTWPIFACTKNPIS